MKRNAFEALGEKRVEAIGAASKTIDESKPHFWLPPGEANEVGALTAQTVLAVEDELGVIFPPAYLALLQMQNGGKLRYQTYRVRATKGDLPTQWMGSLAGIGPNAYRYCHKAEESPTYVNTWEMPRNLVLLSGDGHWWIALDYRKCGGDGDPPVVYVDTEIGNVKVKRHAPSFSKLVEKLFIGDEQYVYGFITEQDDPSSILAALQETLGITFKRFPVQEKDQSAAHEVSFRGRKCRRRSWSSGDLAMDYQVVRNQRTRINVLMFPDRLECTWFFKCEVGRERQASLEEKLSQLPVDFVTIHVPPWKKLGT